MVRAGLNLTHKLDDRFGLAPKTTLSQRDVPGITRSTLPILSAAGVDYISIGTNNGPYKPVSLPNAFRWRESLGGAEAIVTWYAPAEVVQSLLRLSSKTLHRHNFGYGSIEDSGKTGAWEDCADGNDGCEDGLAEPAYLRIPGFDRALVLAWKSDNTGPPGCNRDLDAGSDLAGNGSSHCNLTAGVAEVVDNFRC